MGLNTAKISDFSGGLNLVDDPRTLDLNEFSNKTNLLLTKNIEIKGKGGEIAPRRGCLDIATTVPLPATGFTGANNLTNIHPFRQSAISSDLLIMSTDDGDIYVADVSLSVASITPVFTSAGTAQWVFQQAQDSGGSQMVWMINGSDPPKKMSMGLVASAWSGTPPNGKILAEWKNRMFISGVAAQSQRLYYSDINNPESWPASNFIDIKSVDDESDDVLALQVVGENLLVFKRNSVWVIFDPISLDNRRLAPVGIVNRLCCDSYLDKVFWASPTGIYSTDGDSVRDESLKIKPVLQHLGGFASTHAQLVVTHEDTVMFLPNGNSNPWNGIWICYLKLDRPDGQHPWVYWGGTSTRMIHMTAIARVWANVLNLQNGVNVPGMVGVYSDGVNQFLTYMAVGNQYDVDTTSDVPDGVDAQYFSPWLQLQGGENKERLRRLNIEGVGFPITVSVFTDLSTVADFNDTPPDDGKGLLRVRPETRGAIHQVGWSYNATFDTIGVKSASVTGIELKYRGGKEH